MTAGKRSGSFDAGDDMESMKPESFTSGEVAEKFDAMDANSYKTSRTAKRRYLPAFNSFVAAFSAYKEGNSAALDMIVPSSALVTCSSPSNSSDVGKQSALYLLEYRQPK